MTKNNSSDDVNYLLRPKKQIERKMIIEILQQLSNNIEDIDISEYHYIGLGSIYFADFILFHKYLNIKNMTSIEKKRQKEKRCIFNRPFKFITLKILNSSEFLRSLKWDDDRLLIWLDYDSAGNQSMLNDIEIVASNAKANDILLITVNAKDLSSGVVETLEEFEKKFRNHIPARLKRADIRKDVAGTLNSIINAGIQNGLKAQEDINYLQFLNLVYKDTAKMYTCGLIFCNENCAQLRSTLSKISWEMDKKILNIDCPVLTPKEKRHIDSQIEKNSVICNTEEVEKDVGLKKNELDNYCKYYKYYPQFFESIY